MDSMEPLRCGVWPSRRVDLASLMGLDMLWTICYALAMLPQHIEEFVGS